jgi:type II secretory pathway component PulL
VSKARENKEFFQNTIPENKKISTAGAVDKKEIQKTEPVSKKSDFVPNTTRKITHTPNTDAAEDLY